MAVGSTATTPNRRTAFGAMVITLVEGNVHLSCLNCDGEMVVTNDHRFPRDVLGHVAAHQRNCDGSLLRLLGGGDAA